MCCENFGMRMSWGCAEGYLCHALVRSMCACALLHTALKASCPAYLYDECAKHFVQSCRAIARIRDVLRQSKHLCAYTRLRQNARGDVFQQLLLILLLRGLASVMRRQDILVTVGSATFSGCVFLHLLAQRANFAVQLLLWIFLVHFSCRFRVQSLLLTFVTQSSWQDIHH
jgi:hypothetical protein